MPQEVIAALTGASISAFLMVLSNRSHRREADIREIFHRLNKLEQDLARIQALKPNKNLWKR